MSRILEQPDSGELSPQMLEYIVKVRKDGDPYLYLGHYNLTSVPAQVMSLEQVETINLTSNNLRTVPAELGRLPRLRHVILIDNPIESLPRLPGLAIDGATYRRCCRQIAREDLADLVIGPDDAEDEDERWWVTEWPNLVSLRSLTLGRWSITIGHTHAPPSQTMLTLLRLTEQLPGLKRLAIRGLGIGAVPGQVARLRELAELDLSALGLTALPEWLGDMALESLSAVDNRLTALPWSMKALTKLRHLDLSYNSLTTIPDVVFELRTLQTLRMDDCRLTEVPSAILRLSALEGLDLRGNEIESPPKEIVDKGLDAIRDYWRQRGESGVDYLCEAKLIILGEPGAGKTSLARKIQDAGYRLREGEKSTEGIDVIRYQFPTGVRARHDGREEILSRNFQVNIWDFGGQEIYHATHQFFLTRRSVYVLVCDDRKEDTDFSYWLQVVETLSDASPVLIVQNEKQDRTRDINGSSLRARFSNIRDVLATNLDTNRGLDRVVQTIRRELEALPHVGVGLPATWKAVREAIEKDPRDYIDAGAYFEICERHGFSRREDELQLSGYLHDLGICLHFHDDALLKNVVVLKPSWATDAVYRVLDDKGVIAARGEFSNADLARIWSEPKYRGMHDELVRLMMKFQLCYRLESDGSYIAPQLLSSEKPSYPWEPSGGLTVHYTYVFMPKGILTRFIVAMHHLIADDDLVWRTGVVLQRDGSRAEVIEEYADRRIRVRVAGPNPQGLLTLVDDQLQRLRASFPRLQCDRLLPCPCSECRAAAEPYCFSVERLVKMARKNAQIQCHNSGEMVEASQLLRDALPGALTADGQLPLGSGTVAAAVVAAPAREVFVSYGWTPESSAVVDRVQAALEGHGIRLLRDRQQVRYKDSIREFMRRMGQGKAIVVIVSDKYLTSEHCMFEMLEIAKAHGLRERIFPIVMPDANIYKATGRAAYVGYWEAEWNALDAELKKLRGDNLQGLQDDLNLYSEIRRLFDGIAETLRDMNALSPDEHQDAGFDQLIERIRSQVG